MTSPRTDLSAFATGLADRLPGIWASDYQRRVRRTPQPQARGDGRRRRLDSPDLPDIALDGYTTAVTADEQDMQWGYVLRREGVEVISLLYAGIGPIVSWSADPRTAFNDHLAAWSSLDSPPVIRASHSRQPKSAPAAAPAKVGTPRPAARR